MSTQETIECGSCNRERRPTIKVNGVKFNLGKEDGMSTCIHVGEKFALSEKQIKKLYENGKVKLKDGTFIEVYYE